MSPLAGTPFRSDLLGRGSGAVDFSAAHLSPWFGTLHCVQTVVELRFTITVGVGGCF